MRPASRFRLRALAALALALGTGLGAAQAAPANAQAQLQAWRDQDQAMMGQPEGPATQAERRQLTDVFRQWVKAHGWPLRSEVGAAGAQSAWLLVQHADHDPAWQQEALALMEALLPRGEVNLSDLAYLRDRVAMATKGRQSYGTQGGCQGPGQWEPFAIDEPESLDRRREAMELQSMSRYRAQASRVLCSAERLAAKAAAPAPAGSAAR
ncbi:hypothetical protein QRD43_01385 [Pelomonas sp. APW6]|uniref:Uncharacterized protein n=1 Tax=Roseateles subflavus TaxID=3053353 RepID=A0ABT7LCG1_9BURK|nr:DUF6624 domain-containing protein [Pelomonas sp. APW6]MDL5030544.1 hypothetical protein [Pelomonas sp. APW6]